MEEETDLWAWVRRDIQAAMTSGDQGRITLCRLALWGMEQTRFQPDQRLEALSQARTLAADLGESWWVLFCDHWILQTLLFRKRDFGRALPLALAATEEAKRSVYSDFPQRHCLQEDLISAYQGIDPHGYAAQIEEALGRMGAEIPPQSGCFHCLQELRTGFLIDMGRLDEARDQALLAAKQAALASDYHHVSIAYANLCRIAFQQENCDRLAQWSAAGDLFAGRGADENAIAELWMWSAAAKARSDDRAAAVRQYRKARRDTLARHAAPSTGYYDAWCAFHEAMGHLRRALDVRGRESALLEQGGQIALLCRCRLQRCRLLSALGRPFAEDAAALRDLSGRIGNPKPLLETLSALEG